MLWNCNEVPAPAPDAAPPMTSPPVPPMTPIPVRVVQDAPSWQAGYIAGMSGGPRECPPEIPDSLAYVSGYIEGKAARQRAAASTPD